MNIKNAFQERNRDFQRKNQKNDSKIQNKECWKMFVWFFIGAVAIVAGSEILVKLAYLVVLYIIVLLIVNYGVIGGSVAMFSKCTTFKQFFKSMYKVQLFAFTTASSMATLPLNMKTTIEELHVSKETTSFALPLGATINMNGNAAYYAMAAIFFAQMFGIELTITQYIAIILLLQLVL